LISVAAVRAKRNAAAVVPPPPHKFAEDPKAPKDAEARKAVAENAENTECPENAVKGASAANAEPTDIHQRFANFAPKFQVCATKEPRLTEFPEIYFDNIE
jgi:hypothetical protein